ncbi:helix-turn-helix domain-containing protein [Streptomyces boncukensis]|uniref:Helix-turn-helix transcriptional regulator n=1 Tax=Streptomyces boncukensis TaxID=2711219 RepID=A0A6G4WQC6_9ACTN|nr:helix-turn-helix transcriptional regulator [Streptomyces boncukensis]NGO67032.1 helix-turn-helix transcriptional regulator [Streptomyces boncukensis]
MIVRSRRTAEVQVPAQEARRCTRCSCRLSRYNQHELCGSCHRSATFSQPPASVPEDVCNRHDVRHALSRRDFGGVCRLVREHGGLRQEDMAILTGLSQSFLSQLELGNRRLTNIDRIVVLLDGIGAPADMTGPMLRLLPDE